MKKLLVLMVGILLMTAMARAAQTREQEYNTCVKALTGWNMFVKYPYKVPEFCSRFPMRMIACAMDMTDMGQSADFFEGLEYCYFPFPGDRR